MDSRGYYFDKPYIKKYVIFDNPYAKKYIITDPNKDMPKLLEKLKSQGVTHWFCNENFSNTGSNLMPKELMAYTKLVYRKNKVYLYEFVFPTNKKEG